MSTSCEYNWNHVPRQPISYFVNVINASLLLTSARRTTLPESYNAIIACTLFEVVHAISHATQMSPALSECLFHFCGLIMMITTFRFLQTTTQKKLSFYEICLLSLFMTLDLAVFVLMRGVYTNPLTMILIFVLHLEQINHKKQCYVIFLIYSMMILFLMIVVERLYCEQFLKIGFPYHAIVIESWIIILFGLLTKIIFK
jgi:hypothetical protein